MRRNPRGRNNQAPQHNRRGRHHIQPHHHQQQHQQTSNRYANTSNNEANRNAPSDDANRLQQQASTSATSTPSVSSQSSSVSSPHVHRSNPRDMYQKTYNTPKTKAPGNHQQAQQQPTPQQSNLNQQQQLQPPAYVKSKLDLEVDSLCSDVQCGLMRGIDSTYSMPLSEHCLYSSYESYDKIMIEQREKLNGIMSKLSECSDRPVAPQVNYGSGYTAPLVQNTTDSRSRIEFSKIENLRDKYETIHEFSEHMFDSIGHSLDDAEGFTSRDAQLVQATLEAANQHKLSSATSSQQTISTSQINYRDQQQQSFATPVIKQENLSSSSSSSSLTRPSETNSPATSIIPSNQQQEHDIQPQCYQQQQRFNQLQKFNRNYQRNYNPQVNNVVQSNNYPHNTMRSQYGGFLGKQQYGSPNPRFAMLENKNIPRPQDQFNEKIDNSYRPFEPIIRVKPNASVPLNLDVERDEQGNEFYTHPYEYEIQQFHVDSSLLVCHDPIEPPDLNSTPIMKVETVQELEAMCQHIESQNEFAVDVEHHSYRSYQGLTCLLQISTRTQDFIIDAIKLRCDLHRLNRSFTDSNIVKVFHGADCDILWLQRDFGVYVVNLFDTSRAAKMMKFAHLSLAFLMKHYCNVDPDKSYQLADWRERPLPLPMLQYARSDTHYLLYIYDRLRNDLLMKNEHNKAEGVELLRAVFRVGKDICLKRYEKPPFSDKSHLSVLRKSRSTFNAKQMYAFKEMYAWRDAISRELDESVGYVLPNNLMIRIAEYLPREPQGITALCNPVPPTLKKYLTDVHTIILRAIDVPLDEASKVMSDNPLNIDPSLRSIDLDTVKHKQDIAHSAGLYDSNVPDLLDRLHLFNCSTDDQNGVMNCNYERNPYVNNNNNQPTSALARFFVPEYNKRDYMQGDINHSIPRQFVSPYQMYEASHK